MPIVVVGPSGVGKSTLVDRLISEFPDVYSYNVSHTTRPPRVGEKDQVDYYFVQLPEMLKMIEEGEFIEHANYNGNYYGTSFKSVKRVEEQGKIAVLIIDIQGAEKLKKMNYKSTYIFIDTPSLDRLKERLEIRGNESEDQIKNRLNIAQREIQQSEMIRWNSRFLNDDLEQCYRNFVSYLWR